MLQIAVCEDEQADRDNLIGILKPFLEKYEEEYRITNFTNRRKNLCCCLGDANVI